MNLKSISIALASLLVVLTGLLNVTKFQVKNNEVASATPGDTISTPSFSVGGVLHTYRNVGVQTATSTLCVVQAPAATSTLTAFTFQPSVSTSTAVLLTLATSSSAYAPAVVNTATTTVLAGGIEPANSLGGFDYFAATTLNPGTNLGQNGTSTALTTRIAPNGYVLLYGRGGGAIVEGNTTGQVFNGNCTATFRHIK